MNTHHGGGYMTEMEGVLDMVWRLAPKLMKTGGGALAQEMPARTNRGYRGRITPEGSAQIVADCKRGVSLMAIARQNDVSFNTVCRHTRKVRTGKMP
jgi:hypothetical protein